MEFSIDKVVETLKRATALTKKYGANMLFLNEIEPFEKGIVKLTQERYNDLIDCETALLEDQHEWTPDWPTEPGWYWFYGNKYGESRVSMGTVRVDRISNGVMTVMDGHFMYPSEGHVGVFQRLPTPVVPFDVAVAVAKEIG